MSEKLVKRDEMGRLLRGSVNNPHGRGAKYQKLLAELVGPNGEKAFHKLFQVMQGNVFIPRIFLPNGKEMQGEPQVPTQAEQIQAAREILHYQLGKPVNQVEALSLERKEAEENAALAALSNEEVFAKAREVLGLPAQLEASQGPSGVWAAEQFAAALRPYIKAPEPTSEISSVQVGTSEQDDDLNDYEDLDE